MLEIMVYYKFFDKYFTGEFESVEEAKEWYAMELDCQPEDIIVIDVNKIKEC